MKLPSFTSVNGHSDGCTLLCDVFFFYLDIALHFLKVSEQASSFLAYTKVTYPLRCGRGPY